MDLMLAASKWGPAIQQLVYIMKLSYIVLGLAVALCLDCLKLFSLWVQGGGHKMTHYASTQAHPFFSQLLLPEVL